MGSVGIGVGSGRRDSTGTGAGTIVGIGTCIGIDWREPARMDARTGPAAGRSYMTPHRWTYPADLRESLEPFGLSPPDGTPPAVVRDALNDLYRYELRRLRDRLLAHEFERADYLDRVVLLRKKYWPLTLPLAGWERICGGEGGGGQ